MTAARDGFEIRDLPATLDAIGGEAFRERTVARGFWRKLRRSLGQVPFAEHLVAAWYCAQDPATPPRVRTILIGALAYFVLPADMVPDFIPGVGFLDDGVVIAAAVSAIGGHLLPGHRARAREWLDAADGPEARKEYARGHR